MFHQQYRKNLIRYATTTVLAIVLVLSFGQSAKAASLGLAPATTKVIVGNIFSTRVLINTAGKPINNSEGIIQYPADMLEVMSINKSSSIFSLWVTEPKFSNIDGKIEWNGGLPNPGYTGLAGEVVSVVFRAKKPGTASIIIGDAAIRQNDGLGTDILSSKSNASIEISPTLPTETLPPAVSDGAPSAPIVTSTTHPVQGKWYNNPDVELKWDVPTDVIGVSTLVGKSPTSVPSVVYDPPIGNKKIAALEDGVWYFHIRFKNRSGWGAITHFKIQIDTVAPNPFKIKFPNGSISDDPSPLVSFKTTDNLSGIDYYEVKVDDNQFTKASIDEVSSNSYSLSDQEPGAHNILVKAVDLADNETVQTGEFTIASLNSPKIEDYPSELTQGDLFKIRGTTYPNIQIEVDVADSSDRKSSIVVNSLADGQFTAIWPKTLSNGSYTLTARAFDSHGSKSSYTKPLSFTVKPSALSTVGLFVLNWVSLIIILLLILALIILIIWYFIHRALKIRKSLDDKINATKSSLHKAFDILRDNIREQIEILEKTKGKRELTREEEKIIRRLQEDLTKSEKMLEKEIGNIEGSK